MKRLSQYIIDRFHQAEIFEGGASGHMLHPFDVDEFTGYDIEDLIHSMFGGKIEGMTEKMDGFGMQASMNRQGEVVFIRNKTDLNSEKGGMTIDEFQTKWKDNPVALENYTKGGRIIEAVFKKVGKDFFNPNDTTKITANCECIIEGTTNTIPYASDQVDFHNLWIYEWNGQEWLCKEVTKKGLDKLEKACEGIDNAKITPNVIIKYNDESAKLERKWLQKWADFLTKYHCSPDVTMEGIKFSLFYTYIDSHYPWIAEDHKMADAICRRWLFGDKSISWKEIKATYQDHADELAAMDKKASKFSNDVLLPLQLMFYGMGADLIKITQGFINQGQDQTVKTLLGDLKVATEKIKKEGSLEDNEFLQRWLDVLKEIGEDNISSAEGIVFTYKGKMMKWTGGFVPLNRIIGYSKYSMSPKTLSESLINMKSLLESIFSDNVKSAVKINGIEIYEPDWKLCQTYFEKRRKKYFDDKSTVTLGDMEDEYTILYNEKDCVICLMNEEEDLYVLSTETVYMNHYTDEWGNGRNNAFSLTNIDEANDFSICFSWIKNSKVGHWQNLEGVYGWNDRQKAEDELGISTGYIPETISSKAKSIIQKYIK